jgi:glutamate racemase
MCAVAAAPTILVFDSGLGGLTVFHEVLKARPDARYLYVADDAFFPYGGHGEAELVARVVALMGELIETHRPDLIVIACNTASTLVLPHLRARFPVPFVGTVPAIKPACAQSVTKRVTVLGTEATVSREYTRALIIRPPALGYARDRAKALRDRRLRGQASARKRIGSACGGSGFPISTERKAL